MSFDSTSSQQISTCHTSYWLYSVKTKHTKTLQRSTTTNTPLTAPPWNPLHRIRTGHISDVALRFVTGDVTFQNFLLLITSLWQFAPSLCEQICASSLTWHAADVKTRGGGEIVGGLGGRYMSHSVACDISQAVLSLPSTNLLLLHLLFLSATSQLISLSDLPPTPTTLPTSFCAHSVSGIKLGRPWWAGFSRGNKRGHPEGRSAHRFRDPAAGGSLCHRDPVRSSGHPIYWARQSGWEVNATRRLTS